MTYDLFSGIPPHECSDTSINAALEIMPEVGRLQAEVLRCIRIIGSYGRTDDEIEVILGLRHQTASARRRELVLMELVKDSGRRRKTRSGRKACVWVVK